MTSRVTFLAPGSVVITTPVKTCLAWGGMRATTSALVHWPRAGAHYPPAQGLFRSALLPVYRIKIDNIFVARQSTLFISRKTWPQINRRIIKRLMQRLHMTSWQPCWCNKPILWEFNFFLMLTLYNDEGTEAYPSNRQRFLSFCHCKRKFSLGHCR